MKLLLLIVVILFVDKQVDAGARSKIDEDEETCIEELNLNRDNIQAASTTKLLPENNGDFTKLIGCTGKRKGMIKPNGEINFEKIAEELLTVMNNDSELDPNEFKMYTKSLPPVIQNCQQQLPTGTDPQLSLIRIFNCAIKELEERLKNL